MTKPSPSTELNTFSSIVIHHKENESGFVICPNKSTAVNTGLENILRYWLVKVYIVFLHSAAKILISSSSLFSATVRAVQLIRETVLVISL